MKHKFLLAIVMFINTANASVSVHMDQLSAELDLNGYQLQWSLHQKNNPDVQLVSDPIPLGHENEWIQSKNPDNYPRFTLKAPFYGFEYPDCLLNTVYDQVEVKISKILSTGNFVEAYTLRKDLMNSKFKGPLESLFLSVGQTYDYDEALRKDIPSGLQVFIDGATFPDPGFLYPLNLSDSELKGLKGSFYYQSPSNSRLIFMLSHLTEPYRSRDTIMEELKWVKTQTNIRKDSKVNIKEGLFYDKSGQLINVEDALYIINSKGEFRLGLSTLDTKGKRLFHSMLAGSKAIACGGKITIQNGVLKSIDTASGHYKPSFENMREVLNAFMFTPESPIHEDLQVGYYVKNSHIIAPKFFKLFDFFAQKG